jgi:hypothetical protein
MATLDDIPTQSEYVQHRNAVLAMKDTQGKPIWTPAQDIAAIGANPDGRTWRQINEERRLYLAAAPPAASAQGNGNGGGNPNG